MPTGCWCVLEPLDSAAAVDIWLGRQSAGADATIRRYEYRLKDSILTPEALGRPETDRLRDAGGDEENTIHSFY